MLKKKEKCCRAVDQAYAIDVDFDGMKADAIKALVPYEKFMNSDSLWSKEYLKERYPDERNICCKGNSIFDICSCYPGRNVARTR